MITETLETPAPRLPTIIPDTKEIEAKQKDVFAEADKLIIIADPETGALQPITTREQYKALDILVGKLAAGKKGVLEYIETVFKKHIQNAHKTHKDLVADRDTYLATHGQPWIDTANNAVLLMRTFEKEEAEREKKIKDEVEAKRKADEEAATKKAEDDRKEQLRKDEEQKLEKAQQLEADGAKPAEIEKVLNAPPPPPPPPPRPVSYPSYFGGGTPLKASNAGTRKNWTWKVKGETPEAQREAMLELVKAAAANPDAYLDFLTHNDKPLKNKAKEMEAQARVPGIEFYNDPINSNRARA